MSLLRRTETLPALHGPTATVAVLLLAAVGWHLLVPAFQYRGPGIFIDGPLPSVAGVALGLWLWRREPPLLRAVAALAGAFLALLASVLVLGSVIVGPLHAIPAFWGELREGFRLPFSAAVSTWGSPYFTYALWPSLRPFLLWGTLVFVALVMRRPTTRRQFGGFAGAWTDRWAFSAAQRRQMKAYRATYLAAVRGGEAPPAPPPGLMAGGGTVHGLATVHLVLKIGLAVAGALGLVGGAWSLLGDVLKGPIGAIFARGLTGG